MKNSSADWMQTANGKRVNLSNDLSFSPNIMDVAFQLSQINRYCGATVRPYSVAEHSLLVSDMCYGAFGVECALWGLMHDAHETVTGDIPSPVKRLLDSDALRDLERDLDFRIARKFGLEHLIRDDRVLDGVKRMDLVALMTEHRDLQVSAGDWGVHVEPSELYSVTTRAQDPSEVAMRFVHRFYSLELEYAETVRRVETHEDIPCDNFNGHSYRYDGPVSTEGHTYFYEENGVIPNTEDLAEKLKKEKTKCKTST